MVHKDRSSASARMLATTAAPCFGRIRVIRAHDLLEVAAHGRRVFGARANRQQGSHAFAVQAKILGKGCAHEHFLVLLGQRLQSDAIWLKSIAKAVVGKVNQGQKPALCTQLGDIGPLLRAGINSRRIVAAGV